MLAHDASEFLLCTLEQPHCRQQTLDLEFGEGETITLSVSGKGTVHLSGYVQLDDEQDDEDASGMFDDEASDISEEDVSGTDEEEEEEEEIPEKIAKKAKALAMKKILTVGEPRDGGVDEVDEDEDDDDEEESDIDCSINTTAAFAELDTSDYDKLLAADDDDDEEEVEGYGGVQDSYGG